MRELDAQGAAQGRARARKSRHHRAEGYPDDVGELTVGQPLEFAQHEHLMKRIRQPAQRARNGRRIVRLKQERLGIWLRLSVAVSFFIERPRWRVRALAAPAVAGVADNS